MCTMQGSALKSHYNYSNSLRGQQIPEEESMDYNYHSSSNSSTSLDDNEDPYGIQYPTENLGTSWGSYLHSGPPTRAGLAGAHKRLQDAVTVEFDHGTMHTTQKSVVLVELKAHNRSIDGMPQPTAMSTPKLKSSVNRPHKIPNSKTLTLHSKNLLLLGELKKLTEAIHISHKAIVGNGINSEQLKLVLDTAQRSYSTLKQLCEGPTEDTAFEALSTDVLIDTIHYLIEVLKGLVQQSQKLQQEALSLQRIGRQLNRNQKQYFREQREIHEAIEDAKLQLTKERQAFDEEMTTKRDSLRQIHHDLSVQAPITQDKLKVKSTLGTVHEVMQERNQLQALLRTQKEQTKLEKLLLRQQRDIQRIQRDLDNSRTELVSTQNHALKLEHKLTSFSRKALPAPHKENITQTLKMDKRQKRHTLTDSGWQGILTAQKALDREILRIKRQLEEQQQKEELVSKQLEASSRNLKKRGVSLKHQAASIKGRNFHVPRKKLDYSDPYKPPVQQRKTHIPQLPQVQQPPVKQETKKRARTKPTYTFSKKELVSLACFSGDEATGNVLEWLELQGHLLD